MFYDESDGLYMAMKALSVTCVKLSIYCLMGNEHRILSSGWRWRNDTLISLEDQNDMLSKADQ